MLFVKLMSMCISDLSITTDTGDVTHWPCLVESENSNLLVPEWRLRHEIISTAILPLPLIHEEQLSVNAERMCTKYW